MSTIFSQKPKNPCSKCLYHLGIIKTVINPCPNCKLNGYKTYEHFNEQIKKHK